MADTRRTYGPEVRFCSPLVQAIRNYGRWKAVIVGVEWVRRCEEEQQAVSHEEHMPELMLREVSKNSILHVRFLWTPFG